MWKCGAGLVVLFCLTNTDATTIKNFQQAKREARIIYQDHRIDFYCSCRFDKELKVDFASCGYNPRKNPKRAARIEWEHIVPAENFGRSRVCWREKICVRKNGKKYGGRACCQKIDPIYRQMGNDLMNLVPAVGEVNGDRSNFRYAELNRKPYQYGRCTVVIDFKEKRIQPPIYTKGFIARTYFYMHKQYGLPMSHSQQQLFEAWNKMYPVDNWESMRQQRIAVIQAR